LIASDTKRRQRFQRSKYPDVKEKQTENTQQKNPPQKKERQRKNKSEFKNCAKKLPGFSGLKTSW
jgi:hypothetical protein